jgi:nicotinate phosphoribosyltransferase
MSRFLDIDAYKLSMGQAVAQHYPNAEAQYELIVRGPVKWPPIFRTFMRDIHQFCDEMPSMTREEREFLEKHCSHLTPFYRDFLAGYKYDPSEISHCGLDSKGKFHLGISGKWYRNIHWETQLMALISEIYHQCTTGRLSSSSETLENIKTAAAFKGAALEQVGAHYAEGGTRRRHSLLVQDAVVEQLASYVGPHRRFKGFVGTSNVALAMKYGVAPIGTQAHEWHMFHGATFGYLNATRIALQKWMETYEGRLGIALTDTYTLKEFLRSFGPQFARLFDGVRQDSGDPRAFTEAMIPHYEKLGIDPASKTIIYSNDLNAERMCELQKLTRGRIKASFLAGNSWSCDVPGVTPLNMVIKMTRCRLDPSQQWRDTVKLSDDASKNTGNPEEIRRCKEILGIE